MTLNLKRTHSMSKSHSIKMARNVARKGSFLLLLVAAFVLASCSESDDTTNEWENWKQKNDTYWASLYTQTKQRIASGDNSWKILPKWSMSNQTPTNAGTVLSIDSTDCIVVHVEKEGEGTETPNYTDTVQIHYLGRLIPSPTYTSGYIFDASYDYTEGYNLQIMRPYTSTCGNFISGFTTALLNMHEGDRWMVYIPYNLAYGSSTPGTSTTTGNGATSSTSSSSSSVGVQPYSNLIFDITMAGIYSHGEKVPTVYSKQNNMNKAN